MRHLLWPSRAPRLASWPAPTTRPNWESPLAQVMAYQATSIVSQWNPRELAFLGHRRYLCWIACNPTIVPTRCPYVHYRWSPHLYATIWIPSCGTCTPTTWEKVKQWMPFSSCHLTEDASVFILLHTALSSTFPFPTPTFCPRPSELGGSHLPASDSPSAHGSRPHHELAISMF